MRVHDFFETKKMSAKDDPCWNGYHMVGTKQKDGREVPNCVPGKKGVDEAKADVNFDAEDLKRLERINDLETLKTQAFDLISKPSAKPMKPEKVAWFKQALAGKSNKIAVIKMMYDLMLSGEGNSVIGSKNSMTPNSYRKVFNSATNEHGINEFAPPSGDDGFNDETLKRMAAQWWQGDEDPRIEKTLAAAGWEIGQDEGYDNGGVFVVQSGDINGKSYMSWPAEELEGLVEAYQNDESNLWYIYDKTDGRLKQKMIDNLDEPRARSMGYRDSIDGALRVANIIRSKFDAKKFVQKQGNQWVQVYPFGKPDVAEAELDPRLQRYIDNNPDEVSDSVDALRNRANAEGGRFKWAIGKLPDGRFVLGLQGNIKMLGLPVVDQGVSEAYSSPPPFKDMIASIYRPKVGDKIRTRKGGQIPGTVEKVADLKGIEYCWFRHPEGKLYKTPCSNVMRG